MRQVISGSNLSNMALKFDIRKNFDTMRWGFLLLILKSFCFCDKFCDWIRSILESARISILFNGSPKGYFSCDRDVVLGNPLSPLLFCLGGDFLSCLILRFVQQGRFLHMH